jgi:hypothetical protein
MCSSKRSCFGLRHSCFGFPANGRQLALFFQIAFRLGLASLLIPALFAFELLPFALPQIGFVFSN